jgi:hypothetical protein
LFVDLAFVQQNVQIDSPSFPPFQSITTESLFGLVEELPNLKGGLIRLDNRHRVKEVFLARRSANGCGFVESAK